MTSALPLSLPQMAKLITLGMVAHGAAIVRPPGHHAESNMAMGFWCVRTHKCLSACLMQVCIGCSLGTRCTQG